MSSKSVKLCLGAHAVTRVARGLCLPLLLVLSGLSAFAQSDLSLTASVPEARSETGHAVVLKAAVSTRDSLAKVRFFDGPRYLGTAPVVDAQATLISTMVRPGRRLLRAVCRDRFDADCGSAATVLLIKKREYSGVRATQAGNGQTLEGIRPELRAQDQTAFSLGTSAITVSSAGGLGTLLLSGSAAWTAVSNSPWLHVPAASTSGQGNAVIPFTYDSNVSASPQSGSLTIAGLTLTVQQAGSNDLTAIQQLPLITTALNSPSGVAIDAQDNLYIADTGNNAIEQWNPTTQQLTTIAAGLLNPSGVAVDSAGDVYFADTGNGVVDEWNPTTQQITTLAAGLSAPSGVAVDVQGNVYIAETGASDIREWVAATQQVIVPISSGLSSPAGIAVDLLGNVYIADPGLNAVDQWNPLTQSLTVLATGLNNPTGVAVDGQGNAYIADSGTSTVKLWSAATGQVTTLPFPGLLNAGGVGLDSVGQLYAADTGNNAVEQLITAYVGASVLTETALAGTDTFHVLPATVGFSASSNQSWLTLTSTANGVTDLSFQTNASAASRVAQIAVLGQQLTVLQQSDTPALMVKSAGDGQSVLPQQTFPAALQVVVTDSTGNPIQGAMVTFAVANANGGAAAVFSSGNQCVVNTDTTGTATASILTANSLPGSFTVTATVSSLSVTFGLSTSAVNLTFASQLIGSGSGSGSIILNLSTGNASWTASSNASWIHIAPGSVSGSGSESIQYTVDPNATGTPQSGTITVAGQTFTVLQAGVGSVQIETSNALVSSGLDLPFGVASDRQGNLYIADTGHNAIQKWTAATQQLTALVSSGLNSPHGVAVDTQGNVYIADASNNAIKEWNVSSGLVSTLVGSGLKFPLSVAVDGQGNVYIADFANNAVKQWNPVNQAVTTLIGSGLSGPTGVAVDGSGNVYVTDFLNSAVKQWSPSTQSVTSILSSGLSLPNSLTLDGQGNLLIIDGNNEALKQWKAVNHQISTFTSGLQGIFGVATDSQGNFYLASPGTSSIQEFTAAYITLNNNNLNEPAQAGADFVSAQIIPAGTPLSVASDQTWLSAGAISGSMVNFSFLANTSTASRTAHLMILGQSVTVTQGGDTPALVTKVAGDVQNTFAGTNFPIPLKASVLDAKGSAVQNATVTFTTVQGPAGAAGTFLVNGIPVTSATIVTDSNGNASAPTLTANAAGGTFTVTATANTAVATYTLNILTGALGTTSATVGAAAGSASVLLVVAAPWVAASNASWLHVASNSKSGTGNATIQFTFDVNTSPQIRTGTMAIAGATFSVTQIGTSYLSLSGIGTLVSTGFKVPQGDILDAQGNVYVADTGDNAIKEWNAVSHAVTTLVSTGLNGPSAVAVDAHGNVYFTDSVNNAVKEWFPLTGTTTTLAISGLSHPFGIGVDGAGNVYIADYGHNAIKKWTPGGVLTTLVSTGIGTPRGLALDAQGNVYFADTKNNQIKEWIAATGAVSALVSGLNSPSAVAVDGQGNVYIADTNNNLIKRWSPATLQVTSFVTAGLKGPGGVALDALGNIYIVDTGNNALKEYSTAYLSLSATSRTEPAAAGSDLVTALVYPTNTVLAPISDQSWLTVTGINNGVVGFSFLLNNNAAARTGHVYILGQPVTITQSADVSATMTKTTGTGQSVATGATYPALLQVRMKDMAGNIVKGVSVTYTAVAGANGASGTFPGGFGTLTVASDSSGLATATALTANAIAGSFTVKVVAGSLNTVFTLTITAH